MFKIVRSPLRISFVGGGTDFDFFIREFGYGTSIGASFDAFVYLTALPLHQSAKEVFRFTYRQSESVNSAYELSHPVMREILKKYPHTKATNFATFSTLPGESGLASSSAFTVAACGMMRILNGEENIDKLALANEAIEIERCILREKGGYQDQLMSAVGGFNQYFFGKEHFYKKFDFPNNLLEDLSENLILVKVGNSRLSHQVHNSSKNISSVKLKVLEKTLTLTEQVASSLKIETNLSEVCKILAWGINEGWKLKKESSPNATNNEIDDLIEFGLAHGASAGKLLGAGGSGYVLFLFDSKENSNFAKVFENSITYSPRLTYTGFEYLQVSSMFNNLGEIK